MGLKFRRGTTAQKSGSLAFGEPYVNTDLNTLQVGGANGDILLAAAGTSSVFVGQSVSASSWVSASALNITGNANIGGNLTLGGQLTIGDNTSDTVNVVASLSSSLIPSITNIFDLGSADKIWRDLYISTGSIKIVNPGTGTVVGTLSSNATGDFKAAGEVSGSSVAGLGNATSYSASVDYRIVRLESDMFNVTSSVQALNRWTGSISTTSSVNTLSASIYQTDATQSYQLTANALTASNANTIVSASAWGAFQSASSYSASVKLITDTFATSASVASATATSISTLSGSVKTVTDAISGRVTTLEGKDISITLTGDVTGTGTITDLANVSFATTIAANSVALGTDTTGDYVASLVAGTGVTLSNNSGEGATPTISIGQAVATNSAVTFASVAATGDIVAYSTSDKRHKNNIQLIPNALEKVSKLNGVTWEWNDDVEDVTKLSPKTGLIAQEVQEVLPEVVTERENGFLGLDYSKMVGLLVEAIKEQQTQIAELKAEVEALKK